MGHREIARQLDIEDAYRVVVNNGAKAGQSVFHLHLHILSGRVLVGLRMSNLEERIDRLESLDQIRQLASKYAVSLDMRALDMHVNLFVPDVKVGKSDQGRQALKAWADKTFRDQFKGTSHHIGNHIIEFLDSDNAIGLVYSKNEHETNDEWVIMQMLYWDVYARVDGEWLFKNDCQCIGMQQI